jgi:hypothetical protein
MIFAPGSGMRDSGLRSRLTLPKEWKSAIQTALVHVISLAHYACKRAWACGSQAAKTDQRDLHIALDREEIRLKDARMSRIPAHQRPHYQPTERLAILELRAARGWSLAQTADVFQVTTATIASWTKRLDEQGPDALLRLPVPVNKFPEFVTYRRSVRASARSRSHRFWHALACTWVSARSAACAANSPHPGQRQPPRPCRPPNESPPSTPIISGTST